MGIYEELNTPRIINAAGTFTVYGGSRMSPQTLRDMADAASSYVEITHLQRQLCTQTAALTHNEAAYYCNGASSGIYLAALSAVARKCGKQIRHLSRQDFAQSQIIIFRSHRNPYDVTLEQLGVELVELGYSNHALLSPAEDIRAAITEHTAAIFYLESGWVASGAPDLKHTIDAAHSMQIPVILDAAAMLPPVENLWKYTQEGVDLVIFSGGKSLCGPQASGLILGSSDYIEPLLESAFPAHGYGRMFKTGREEMVGLYSALRQFINSDLDALCRDAEEQVALACQLLSDSPFFLPERSYPNEAGQPIPRVLIRLVTRGFGSEQILSYLKNGSPSVVAQGDGTDGIFLNPMSLTKEDMIYICEKLLGFSPQDYEKEGTHHV